MATSTTNSFSPSLWHAAYPAPTSTPTLIRREQVLKMMKQGADSSSRDFVLVDLRGNDYQGGTIRGAINLPAQSLYPTIPTLYYLFKCAGQRKIIWYCSSSKGRGTRAAGWFADHIANQGDAQMESLVLLDGVKGWATAGDEYVQSMIAYDASVWSAKQ